jgi:hypothetical protein
LSTLVTRWKRVWPGCGCRRPQADIALAFGGIAASNAAGTTKPNIVCIVADDLGWKDVGFRCSDIKTPNIDQLARTGARHYRRHSRTTTLRLTRQRRTTSRQAIPTRSLHLKKRASEPAATMEKPLLLQAEFGAMRERLHMPPALPDEEASFNEQE